jgi:two-component system OmpR family response regulator
VLRGEGFACRAIEHGERLKEALQGFTPDIALLDIRLVRGPDGFTVARHLRMLHPRIALLFVTAACQRKNRLKGFDLGCDDYVVKPFDMDELIARMWAVLRRCGSREVAVHQVADLVLDEAGRTARRGATDLRLTKLEFDSLAMLARERGRVVTRSRLLEEIWGYERDNSRLAEPHICSLRAKLDRGRSPLLHTVRGVGYVLRS